MGEFSMDESDDMWPNFRKETFSTRSGYVLRYRLLVPLSPHQPDARQREVNPRWVPLVLALHGASERGHDNSTQLRNGVAELLGSETAAACFPCLYVVPQCAEGAQWVDTDWRAERHKLRENPSEPLSAAVELLEELHRGYPVDPQRVYLIGLSMGGFGVWDLLSRCPDRYAAAVVICGGADENAVVAAREVPVWVFHGADDPVVSVERSRRAVAVLRTAGGDPRYNEYPGVGHLSWIEAFAEPDLLPWLFSHRRATA
jgi:predicted peptidase